MDRGLISSIAHQDHPIAAPLSEQSVERLLQRGLPRGDERILDLGCGPAAWLVRALRDRPVATGVGVDMSPYAITDARAALAPLDPLGTRVELQTGDAREYVGTQPFDLVLTVGAAHAFGGLLETLDAARTHLAPSGMVLVGDGFWEQPPIQATLDLGFTQDEFTDLAATVDRVTEAGWTPVYGHVSTPEEWDDYEWSWTGSLSRWALDRAADPEQMDAARSAAAAAAEHRTQWLRGYRNVLGFLTLLVRPSAGLD